MDIATPPPLNCKEWKKRDETKENSRKKRTKKGEKQLYHKHICFNFRLMYFHNEYKHGVFTSLCVLNLIPSLKICGSTPVPVTCNVMYVMLVIRYESYVLQVYCKLNSSAITCQIVMLTCQIFMSSCQIFMLTCQILC